MSHRARQRPVRRRERARAFARGSGRCASGNILGLQSRKQTACLSPSTHTHTHTHDTQDPRRGSERIQADGQCYDPDGGPCGVELKHDAADPHCGVGSACDSVRSASTSRWCRRCGVYSSRCGERWIGSPWPSRTCACTPRWPYGFDWCHCRVSYCCTSLGLYTNSLSCLSC